MGPFGIGQAVRRFEDGPPRGGGRFQGDLHLPGQACHRPPIDARSRASGLSTRRRHSGLPVSSRSSRVMIWPRRGSARRGRRCLARGPTARPCLRRPTRFWCATGFGAWGIPSPCWSPSRRQAEDGRAGPHRLRAAALGHRHRRGGPARQPAGVGRVSRQCVQRLRDRRPRGDRYGLDRADHAVRRRYVTRVHAQYMEPRASSASTTGRGPLARSTPRAVSPPCAMSWPPPFSGFQSTGSGSSRRHVGGAWDQGLQDPEHRLVLLCARKLGRPVRWVCRAS